MERIVGGKFKLGRKIGSGSFGEIFLGELVCIQVRLAYFRLSVFLYVFVAELLPILCCAATHIDTFEIVAVKIVSSISFSLPKIY